MMNFSLSSIVGTLGLVSTGLISIWAIFKYILLGSYRLSGETSKRLVDLIQEKSSWSWTLAGEYCEPPKYPEVFDALARVEGVFFMFSRGERLMTAGWKSKENISTITFLRWERKKVEKLLKEGCNDNNIPILALSVGTADRLGELSPDPNAEVFMNHGTYERAEEEVKKVANGSVKKTGILLHGKPGNGKTQFVKYLARKYLLPIHVVYLRPDYDNYDIARMFSEVPRRCIVLLEDFDNYFNGRECLMKNDQVRFTFDSVINALDGVHNDYRGVVFVMTANDIDKIDDSIKNRPSRFKFVKEVCPPDFDLRMKVLGNESLAREMEGASLDSVFARKYS